MNDYYEEPADDYVSDFLRGFNGYYDSVGDQLIQSLPAPSAGRGFGRGRGFGGAALGVRGRGGRGRGGPNEMGRGAGGRGRGRPAEIGQGARGRGGLAEMGRGAVGRGRGGPKEMGRGTRGRGKPAEIGRGAGGRGRGGPAEMGAGGRGRGGLAEMGRGAGARGRGGPAEMGAGARGRGGPVEMGRGAGARGRGWPAEMGRGAGARGRGGPAEMGRGAGARGRGGPAEMGRGVGGRGRGGPVVMGRGAGGRGRGGPPFKGPSKKYWCTSCNVFCTSAELLLKHMTGKKHEDYVVELAEAAKAGKEEANGNQQQPQQQQQLPMPQQQQQPGGKKRKAEAAKQSKPLMIGIKGNQYWCFPCSVSADKFELLQLHLDTKKHSVKIKVLGGAETFAPPQPLGPLCENPMAAPAAATSTAPPAKKPKTGSPRTAPPPPKGSRPTDRSRSYMAKKSGYSPYEVLETGQDLDPLPVPPPSDNPARASLGPPRQFSPDDDPIPKTEIRPAWWCNVCNVSCHSDKLLRRHLNTRKHIRIHESYGELSSKFLSANNWLGAPYGRSQPQIGMKYSSFFCYLCEEKLSDSKQIEFHLRSEHHADKIRVGEDNAEADYIVELEELAAAEAAEGGAHMVDEIAPAEAAEGGAEMVEMEEDPLQQINRLQERFRRQFVPGR